MEGHGETSIPPYNFVAGGIIIQQNTQNTNLAYAFSNKALQNSFLDCECMNINSSFTVGRKSSMTISSHSPYLQNLK